MESPVPEAYLEVRVDIPREFADACCDFVIENITSGLVLEDEEDSEVIGVIFYLPVAEAERCSTLDDFLARQRPDMLPKLPSIRKRRVEAASWLEMYRQSVQLVRIADDLIVRPSWISATDDRYQLVLEPKMAFGTGTHATTRSSLRAVRQNLKPGMRFLDMGCGSGILSILADQMGAAYIKAVDYDLAAIANCRENLELNGVQAPYETVVGSIDKCDRDRPFDFVCANIIRTTILTMLPRLLQLTTDGGWLILSGLLDKDETAVTTALEDNQQTDLAILHDEGWLTYTIRKR